MASPNLANIPDLYRRALSVGAVEYFREQAGLRGRRGMYSAQLVLCSGGVATADPRNGPAVVAELPARAVAAHFLAFTGGYCQARQKLPTVLRVSGEITHQLRRILGLQERSGRCVYRLDGSSLEMEHTLVFPPMISRFFRCRVTPCGNMLPGGAGLLRCRSGK